MRKLHYSSGYVLLADQTCKAVMRYARALAQAHESDVVMIPIITEGGSRAYAHMLIGPASQIFSTPVEKPSEEPVDEEVVLELERRTARLHPTRPEWPSEMTDVPDVHFDFDYGL